jgi:hypothetical protein
MRQAFAFVLWTLKWSLGGLSSEKPKGVGKNFVASGLDYGGLEGV